VNPFSADLPKRVACIGGGLIGAGWALHFMRAGCDVVVYDPEPARAEYLSQVLGKALPTLRAMGMADGAHPTRISFDPRLETALSGADFIQESATEDRWEKIALIGRIDKLVPPGVVIASSSSGFLATDLRQEAENRQRIVIGHPFNPPWLVPLVEVAGGDTAPEAAARAAAVYRASGCEVVELSREIDGYIGNRLQFAVFREILYLWSQGVADLDAIDRAMSAGPALRWAVMGPSAVFYMGARAPELFGEFVALLHEELQAGYTAPPEFEPDAALMQAYAAEVQSSIGQAGQEPLRARRDNGVAALRKAMASLSSLHPEKA
jgi:carnitine 3-dehydrogenase